MKIRGDIRRGAFRMAVDLTLPEPGVTALFGPSGSGKTSLLRAMAGLDRHPGCVVEVGGATWQDGSSFVPVHHRPIGFVFQDAALFDHLSVRDNLAYGVKRSGGAVGASVLDQAVTLMGLDHLLDRRPATLSGGERQRVAIARALATHPRILFLDEPLASVDDARKDEILPFLLSLRKDLAIPVVYVTHALEEVVRMADHLVLIEHGAIRASGALRDMLTGLEHPLAHRLDAAAIADVRVAGFDTAYGLTHGMLDGHPFWIPGGPWPDGTVHRVRLAARDISITLEHAQGTSIQNILPCHVAEITDDGPSGVTLRLTIDTTDILARITRKSLHELNLSPGLRVFAQIKGVAILS